MTNTPMNPNDPTEPSGPIDPTEPFEVDPNQDPVDDILEDNILEDNPPPPVGYPTPAQEGLVRDPYATLGGVASGIAHRYGWDVPLVRLGFVVALFASFGTALFLYLIAWMVIPRATVWPPYTAANAAGGFSNRDIGIGLAVVGALSFAAIGGGPAGAVLVPLALVGGGVWLLTQTPREVQAMATGQPSSATFLTPPPPVGQPVAPRSRRRKWTLRILLAAIVLTLLGAVASALLFISFGSITDGGFQVNINDSAYGFESYTPQSLAELPSVIQLDNGAVEVDLLDIGATEWQNIDVPLSLDVLVGRGEVTIYVPDDLVYSLNAKNRDGTITQSNESASAIASEDVAQQGGINSVEIGAVSADSVIDITLSVDSGSIHIITRSR